MPYSTILNDQDGELLAAQIADDGQWRFPPLDSLPEAFKACILNFEDEYFYYHPGINPVSLGRAIYQNLNADHTISGGSTISMQVMRMSRENPSRTYWEKIKEMYLAFRLEFSYSKNDILKLYASHAPYGGNVVGAETAAWRYFNLSLYELSWAEYATLAVLPNAPKLIRPGKNAEILKQKRNRLLYKLLLNEAIDSSTYNLSLLEELPNKPKVLPKNSFHLLNQLANSGQKGKRIKSSIDRELQNTVSESLNRYVKHLQENKINNACALVIDVKTSEVKAYVGNANFKNANAAFVDLVQAKRSSGSILKPFLYAGALDEGLIHTSTLMKDIPISINGFSPTNFNKKYEGAVKAGKALSKSLNIPATNLLKNYGLVQFYNDLQALGFTTINRSANNYGLTLILGGAEISLWDVAQSYTNQISSLNSFFTEENNLVNGLKLIKDQNRKNVSNVKTYTPGAWWLISEVLKEVERPGIEENWKNYSSSRQIAWKTGTSFGFRDAWAVGYDAGHLVAVWVGNAQGEGRPGLTGTSTAAPLMFEIFQHLPEHNWFMKPEANLKYVQLCQLSGLAVSLNCPSVEHRMPINAKMPLPCTNHKKIQLNVVGEQVKINCDSNDSINDTIWFVLDPMVSYYYKKQHPEYNDPPPFSDNCGGNEGSDLAIIYPQKNTELIIPINFDGQKEKLLFEATHLDPESKLFWHLDNEFIGTTIGIHKVAYNVKPGQHQLSILDEKGNSSKVNFKAH